MKIYYDTRDGNLYTEEEAMEVIKSDIERHGYCLDYLDNVGSDEVWSMLTEEAKTKIMEECIAGVIENEFTIREF